MHSPFIQTPIYDIVAGGVHVNMYSLGKDSLTIVFPSHLSFQNETFVPFPTTKLIQFRMNAAIS